MRLLFCLSICLVQILFHAEANKGTYTVIAPASIYSHETYTVTVAVRDVSQDCRIKVGISGRYLNESRLVNVTQNGLKNVEFHLPNLARGDYRLTAEGINCLGNFKNYTKLRYKIFAQHVLILTDRKKYAVGDDVNFRVIFLDKDLKPAEPWKHVRILLKDGRHKVIEEIKNFKTVNGVYTGKFKTSEFYAEGFWTLGTVNTANPYARDVRFLVDNIASQFIVNVQSTESASVKDGEIQVVVTASYASGLPVEGKATVVLSMAVSTGKSPKYPIITETTNLVKGKATIVFNAKVYDGHTEYEQVRSFMKIKATVEEQHTGDKLSATNHSYIYPYRYSVNCIGSETCSAFEEGKNDNLFLQVTHVNGTIVNDDQAIVELICKEVLLKHYWDQKKYDVPPAGNRTFNFNERMNAAGFVNFKVSLPKLSKYEGYSHFYEIKVKYLDEERVIWSHHSMSRRAIKPQINQTKEDPGKYFTLLDQSSSDNGLILNKPYEFTINSSEPLSYFDYIVMARGNILKSGHVDLLSKPKVYSLTLTPEPSWAINFALYVYYVDDKGVLHYDEQKYHLNGELNPIIVTTSEQVKPGDELTFKIHTAPNSFVGLMAIDQRVLSLGVNSDLKPHQIERLLDSHGISVNNDNYEYPGFISGCVTLTNANYFHRYQTESSKISSSKAAQVSPATPDQALDDDSYEQIRNDLKPTWIFDDITTNEKGEFTLSKKMPEAMTSWLMTGFSLSSAKGLGIFQTNITAFRPFYISVRLPYSVKKGEVIKVPVLVFNKLEKDLDVEVTLENNDDEFEFITFDLEIFNENERTKEIHVPANGKAEVSFLIRPKIIGDVIMKFTTHSQSAGDTLHKTLKVVPEGSIQYGSHADLINLKHDAQSSLDLKLPEGLVAAEPVEVIVHNVLLPFYADIRNFIRTSYGNGEEYISNLMINSLIRKLLKYLKYSRSPYEQEINGDMKRDYRNILEYNLADGFFTRFAPSYHEHEKPRIGSTWVTAYAMRTLQQIKVDIDVSEKIIKDGLAYLSKQQAENGSFIERDEYSDASKGDHVALTASVVLALLGNNNYSQQLQKGIDFIAQNIDKSNSLYARAIGTYSLNKVKHATAKDHLAKLVAFFKAQSDRMWSAHVLEDSPDMISYTLLTLLEQESAKVSDALPLIKWLMERHKSYGIDAKNYETPIALAAVIKFIEFFDYTPANMTIDIQSKNKKDAITLREDSKSLDPKVRLKMMLQDTETIKITAKGTGSALVQLAYQYTTNETDSKPKSFTIKTKNLNNTKQASSHLNMQVCVNYVGEGQSSTMALLEINIPSGYVIDNKRVKDIKQLEGVIKTELKNSGTLLVVYFDHLYKNSETCLEVAAVLDHAVVLQKQVPIVLYDYYDVNEKATTVFYGVASDICDIAENEEECFQ